MIMSSNNKAFLAYVAVCFFWGSTFIGIKVGLNYWPPLLMAGVRFLLASVILLLIIRIKGLRIYVTCTELKSIILGGVFMLTLCNGLLCISEKFTSSSLAAIMISLVPIYTAGIEVFRKKTNQLRPSLMFGMIISVLGVLILTWNDLSVRIEGVILLIISGFCWSIGTLETKKIANNVNPIITTMLQMLSGGILLILISSITENWYTIHLNTHSFAPILYLSIFGSVVAFSCYNYVLKHWTAISAGTYTYFNPIVAIILGRILLDEKIADYTIVGVIIILLGTYFVRTQEL